MKFTPKGGRVNVALRREEALIIISVSDTGNGVAPEFLPYLFERFRQADSSSTRAFGGLGLGLAIARHLVEVQGGTIHVESAGMGKGATFEVRLPIAQAPLTSSTVEERKVMPPETAASVIVNRSLVGVSVLVVDDDDDTRDLLLAMLERAGARVTLASSAEEGLASLRAVRPNILISDIGMPGMSGHELIRSVRALSEGEGGRTPALALTAYARAEDRTHALHAGFDWHLTKPIASTEMLDAIAP